MKVQGSITVKNIQSLARVASSSAVTVVAASASVTAMGAVQTNTNSITYGAGDAQIFWDVDGDGEADFKLFGGSSNAGFLDTYNSASESSLNGYGMVQATTTTNEDAFAVLNQDLLLGPTLATGYRWGNSQMTYRTVLAPYSAYGSGSGSCFVGSDARAGGFVEGSDQFFGFRFKSDGQVHYGWAELTINLGLCSFTIEQWAWDDIPDTAIRLGEVPSTAAPAPALPVPVSGPGILGLTLLGLGGVGLRELRRRRKSPPKTKAA